jgi:molybdopterin-guanine dinucleotide biosynthesis protein A
VRRDLGPLGGIHTALAHSTAAVVVVAWDMPFVAVPLLVELRRRGAEGATAVVPESAPGRLEPTCAFYSLECRSALDDWLDSGRSGAAAFLARCAGVERLTVEEVARFGEPARLFFSINTPAALEQAETFAALP